MIVGRGGDKKEIQEIFIDCNWQKLITVWLWELRCWEMKMAPKFLVNTQGDCYVMWSLSKSGRMEEIIFKGSFNSLVGCCFTSPVKLCFSIPTIYNRNSPKKTQELAKRGNGHQFSTNTHLQYLRLYSSSGQR